MITLTKFEVKSLSGEQLDMAVAMCEGYTNIRQNTHLFNKDWIADKDGKIAWLKQLDYSKNWALVGPIIGREFIRWNQNDDGFYAWISETHHDPLHTPMLEDDPIPQPTAFEYGNNLPEAIMRCYVASKFGEYIQLPEVVPCPT